MTEIDLRNIRVKAKNRKLWQKKVEMVVDAAYSANAYQQSRGEKVIIYEYLDLTTNNLPSMYLLSGIPYCLLYPVPRKKIPDILLLDSAMKSRKDSSQDI